MTHVGLVCDDPMLQVVLPQVFLACDRLVPRREVLLLEADLPPFVHVWRGSSSWNNTDTMVRLIALLGRTLDRHATGALRILSMDAVKVHLNARVLRECARWSIRVVVVPPGLTWLLQPLDTHVFAQMKRAIRDAYQARVGQGGGRALSTRSWLDVVAHTVYCFLRRGSWTHAFDHNGFGTMQQHASRRVLTALSMDSAPGVPSTEPSQEQLRLLCPRGTRVNGELLLQRVDAPFMLRVRTTAAWRARHS